VADVVVADVVVALEDELEQETAGIAMAATRTTPNPICQILLFFILYTVLSLFTLCVTCVSCV
jgi:hypothetical protein